MSVYFVYFVYFVFFVFISFMFSSVALKKILLSLRQNVEGTPILELNSGPDAVGLYVSGGSSDGVLTFLYTISEGDSTADLDTSGENSLLTPGGSSIKVGTSARRISQTCRGAEKST